MVAGGVGGGGGRGGAGGVAPGPGTDRGPGGRRGLRGGGERGPGALAPRLAGLAAAGPLRGVVHLEAACGQGWEATAAELREDVERVGGSALSLVQGLHDAGVSPGAGVWFVTRGAQAGGAMEGELSGASLWGFGRTVAQELPALGVRLVDLDPEDGDGDGAERLCGELLAPDRETQVAWRGGRRLVARLARLAVPGYPGAAGEAGRVRGDRSYLVTGGLGGVGLSVAGWLAERGAGAIVLNGRREPGAEAREEVARLRGRGVEVRVSLADVTDEAAVAGLVAGIGPEAGLPPLGGVIHSAGVIADGSVANLDERRFGRALWPKVLGGWHLHRATLALDLDLFVLFSSTAGVLGNAGQSNYAAANAFLDQLARARRERGLPGQAIAWGPWSEVGAAETARERVAARLAAAGVDWLTPRRGVEALDHLVQQEVPAAAAAAVDWSVFGAAAGLPPFFAELAGGAGREAARVGEGALVERLRAAPAAERERLAVEFVQEEVRAVLRLPSPPAADAGFFDLGVDSLLAVELRNRLNRALGGAYVAPNTVVFDHPTPARLGRHLLERLGEIAEAAPPALFPRPAPRGMEDRIAVVGMACRFPGGPDVASFWAQLAAGEHAVTQGRPQELVAGEANGAPPPFGAYLAGLDRFDAEFFRIAPVEAEFMDPQHRLLLEVSWEALEDAGMDPERLRGSRTGVYAGIMSNDYSDLISLREGALAESLYLSTGNGAASAIGRVAFTLGLRGPAIAVDTACSSSLVTIHQAAAGLARGEVDLALAGGVNAILLPGMTRLFEQASMLSPDGRCKTFDAAANGYVRGEGCGMVLLKRLRDAERDGDRILGVLLGSAVNQDGASAGLTVPNGPAQEEVIREALGRAGIEPATVDYLEAHGTGTELGDPIEVQAAAAVYGEGRAPERPLLIGSVKTNVGHLESAAGIAGVVKVLLALREGVIPKHLHFETPNPRIEWDALPVQVVSEALPWPETGDRPLRAGVSSFSLSGTNAHLVFEGYDAAGAAVPAGGAPETPAAPPLAARVPRVLPLSGRSGEALSELAGRYLGWLGEDGEGGEPGRHADRLSDMAWTAGTGRSHFAHRAGLVFGDRAMLEEQLLLLAREGGEREASPAGPRVAFLYTGQGSQWSGMGRDLYGSEPVFRAVLDRCEAVFGEERGGDSLLGVMFGDSDGALGRTEYTQPALFALGAGLTELWRGVGVRPDAVLGHSVGEIAAGWASGAFGLEAGMRFATRRGSLLGSLPAGGGMAAVFAPLEAVEGELRKTNARVSGAGLSLAAANGTHAVVSGPGRLVASLRRRLGKRGVRTERLATSHAFHSGLLEPALDGVEAAAAELGWAAPEVSLVSNLTGRAVGGDEVWDGGYWRRQAREPVRFSAGVETLAGLGAGVLVEIGPRAVLGPLAALGWPAGEGDSGGASGGPAVVASLGRETGFAAAVSGAYEAGVPVSFAGLFAGEERRRVSLPTYPFQRERHWVRQHRYRGSGTEHPLLGVRYELANGDAPFETELSAERPPWLSDHRVFGRVVVPGAFYGAQAVAALRPGGEEQGPVRVEDVRFERPLVLSDDETGDGRLVQFLLDGGGRSQDGGWELFSRGAEDDPWVRHAAGRVRAGAPPDAGPTSEDLERLREPGELVEGAVSIAGWRRGESGSGRHSGPWPASGPGQPTCWRTGPAGRARPDRERCPSGALDACFQTTRRSALPGRDRRGGLVPEGWTSCGSAVRTGPAVCTPARGRGRRRRRESRGVGDTAGRSRLYGWAESPRGSGGLPCGRHPSSLHAGADEVDDAL